MTTKTDQFSLDTIHIPVPQLNVTEIKELISKINKNTISDSFKEIKTDYLEISNKININLMQSYKEIQNTEMSATFSIDYIYEKIFSETSKAINIIVKNNQIDTSDILKELAKNIIEVHPNLFSTSADLTILKTLYEDLEFQKLDELDNSTTNINKKLDIDNTETHKTEIIDKHNFLDYLDYIVTLITIISLLQTIGLIPNPAQEQSDLKMKQLVQQLNVHNETLNKNTETLIEIEKMTKKDIKKN